MNWQNRANKEQFSVYQKRTHRFPYKISIWEIEEIGNSRINYNNPPFFFDYYWSINQMPDAIKEWLDENGMKCCANNGYIKFSKERDLILFKLSWC